MSQFLTVSKIVGHMIVKQGVFVVKVMLIDHNVYCVHLNDSDHKLIRRSQFLKTPQKQVRKMTH